MNSWNRVSAVLFFKLKLAFVPVHDAATRFYWKWDQHKLIVQKTFNYSIKPLQNGPRPLQNGPKTLQSGPKTLQSRPKTLQSRPKTLQSGPKTLQSRPKTLQNASKTLETRAFSSDIDALLSGLVGFGLIDENED